MAARAAAYTYALLVAAGVGHFLLGIPIQLTDSYGNMVKLATPWPDLLVNEFTQRAYLRPFLWAQLKLVYDASGGHYFAWFRGVHVAQVVALVLMYVALVRPRAWREVALLPIGLAALFGAHTFLGTVSEAFPINTFMTILLCCFAAANLAFARPRWWIDALAAILFVIAALTVESGLLVWVIFVGAAAAGARGVSRPGLAALTALFLGYFVLRFGVLQVGGPDLIERASGYGFRTLEPSELMERFGRNPLGFYAYNVLSSVLTVLFSEPRGGVFRLTYGITLRDPEPSAIVNVISSTLATVAIVAFAWRRRGAWRSLRFEHDDRLVLLFLMVLGANAAISYPYTKDVIMSPAGAFFSVALFAALRALFSESMPGSPRRAAIAGVACVVLATAWSIRVVGLHLNLRDAARKVRTEWAYADEWLAEQKIPLLNARERALFLHLQHEAVYHRLAPSPLPLTSRVFDVD